MVTAIGQPGEWDFQRSALSDLRKARRTHRASELDLFDAFYQAYLTAVGCGVVVLLASDIVGDKQLTSANVERVVQHGPAVVGLVVALAVLGGLRSGARGGPLVLPAADVRYVLMAPIPRRYALRGPAIRHVRFLAFGGMVGGAIVGVLVSHRLPGGLPAWVSCVAAAGALVAVFVSGAALVASGWGLSAWTASLIGLVIVGWAIVDIALSTRTAPTTWIGVFALWPVKFSLLGLAAPGVPIVVAVAGVLAVGGLSIEAAERRASLASQIRFALTLQDLRTVVLLRRQLTQEHPRSRPWVRTPALRRGRSVVWRRDLRGLARWPLGRVLRMVVFGVVAGLSLVAVWKGTTPLVVVAVLALYLAGFDALEPLAQEIDHPDRLGSVPAELGVVRLLHMPVSFLTLFVVALIGWGAAIAVAGPSVAVPVGAALLLPSALLATVGSSVSIVMGPPTADNLMLPAEAAGAKMVMRVLWAPVLVLLGLTPLLIARSTVTKGQLPGRAAASASVMPIMIGVLGLLWVRFREPAHLWLKASTTPPSSAAAGCAPVTVMIEAHGLTKAYGDLVALEPLDLEVRRR